MRYMIYGFDDLRKGEKNAGIYSWLSDWEIDDGHEEWLAAASPKTLWYDFFKWSM